MTKKTSNERIQTDLDGLFDRIKGLMESNKKGGLSPGLQKVLDDGVEKLKKIYFDNFKINIRYSGFFLSDLYAKEDQSKILSAQLGTIYRLNAEENLGSDNSMNKKNSDVVGNINLQPLNNNYLDYNSVTNLVNKHLSGKQNKRLLIWSLLNVDEWMKQTL